MDDKVIVTNRSALMKKYGRQGMTKIRQALRALSAADGKRGIKNRVVYLDDAKTMKKLGGKPVMNAPTLVRISRRSMGSLPPSIRIIS